MKIKTKYHYFLSLYYDCTYINNKPNTKKGRKNDKIKNIIKKIKRKKKLQT
jgi:hypothetical protein